MAVKPLHGQKEAQIPKELINSIRDQRCVVLIGSGVSKRCGFPTLNELLEKMIISICGASDDSSLLYSKLLTQPEWIAEILRYNSREMYNKILKDTFSDYEIKKFSVTHSLLALIPFRGYLTTNYDHLIEDYVEVFDKDLPNIYTPFEKQDIMQFVKSQKRFIIKLHGCANRDSTHLVLTSSDYYNLLRNIKYERMLAFLFQRYTIMAFGFSLRDSDFRKLIEERSYLYGMDCPPIYIVIADSEICANEINVYKNLYNVHILKISEYNNFEELDSLLLSIYSLIYSADSASLSRCFQDIINYKIRDSNIIISEKETSIPESLKNVIYLLSVFKDPIDINLFTTICYDYGLRDITPAYIRLISSVDSNSKIIIKHVANPKSNHLKFVSLWLGDRLDSIPINSYPRYLTMYYKDFIETFSNTLTYLLSQKVGWNNILREECDIKNRFYLISEFYKQTGRWQDWLLILDNAEKFIDERNPIFNDVLRNKLFIYFWTRRYSDAKGLLDKYSHIDDMGDKNSYRIRLKYIDPSKLSSIIDDLQGSELDHFGESLLGRVHARLAARSSDEERVNNLLLAKKFLLKALDHAKEKYDIIEISVQSWYLGCICSDLYQTNEAKEYISEAKRLDECIMGRAPGIAWLKVAEYRFAVNDPSINKGTRQFLRKEAMTKMSELGMNNVEEFVDYDYYY